MHVGWSKFHRQIFDNPVCTKDAEYFFVWCYILTEAKYEEERALFKNEEIVLQKGQLLITIKDVASKLNICESKVNRILKKLEIEKQIEKQTSNKNTLITVLNWEKYQADEKQNEEQVKNERQTSEKQVKNKWKTSEKPSYYNKEIKKERNKEYFVVDEMTREEFFNDFFSEQRTATIEQLCMARAFGSIENFKRLATAVLAEWEALPEPKHRDIKAARQHLINHCSRKMSAERREKQTPTTQNPLTDGTRFNNPAQTKRERTEVFASHIFDKLTHPDTPEFDDGFG